MKIYHMLFLQLAQVMKVLYRSLYRLLSRTAWTRLTKQVILFFILMMGTLVMLACSEMHTVDAGLGVLSEPFALWTVSGFERVGIDDQPGDSKAVSLYAARGEYEPFQVAVRALQGNLTNVSLDISNLVSTEGHIISSDNISLYRQHFVYVNNPSPDLLGTNRPLGEGWYADGLIPLANVAPADETFGVSLDAAQFDIDSGKSQPIWVDIFVPRDTLAGSYTGSFTVTSDQGTQSGELSLRVWDFDLPLTPSLKSAFLFYGEQTMQASVELLKHKVNPQFLTNPNPEFERELIDEWGLQSVALPFWSGAVIGNCQMTPAPSVSQIQAASAVHQPELFRYVYSADEIGDCPNLYPSVREWGRAIHQGGASNLVVMAPVPELLDDGSGTGRSAVDVWVVLPKMYENSARYISEALQKGDQVWSYNSLVQDGYSPKWQIDFAPINFRIQPGFMSHSLGLTGLLYWQVDRWTDDPWNDVNTFIDQFDNNRPYPGDGMLVYPGEPMGIGGIVPSMRLKWLREGIEDYEYLQILKELGQADLALELSQTVATDWKNWIQDPRLLESVRRQLGETIEQLKISTVPSNDAPETLLGYQFTTCNCD
jgi:hypothetical protein